MGASPSEYDAVITDLENEIIELQRTVEYLKRKREGGGGPAAPVTVTRAEAANVSVDFPADAFFGMSIPEAAKKYLGLVKRKQTTKQIMEALERGGFPHQSKSFYGTVFGVLSRRWKTEGDIVKVGGDWGLAEWYGSTVRAKAKKARAAVPVPDDDGSDSPTSAE